MYNNLIIYSLNSKSACSSNEIYAFFDNKGKAEDFLRRFKVSPELKIARHQMNPERTGSNYRGNYCVLLQHTRKQSYDHDFYELICSILLGKAEEYKLGFRHARVPGYDMVVMTLYATCKVEAIKEAMVIRDAVERTGEWRLVFLKKQLLK